VEARIRGIFLIGPFLADQKYLADAGSCLPSMVVVALGEPGVPLISWAQAGIAPGRKKRQPKAKRKKSPRHESGPLKAFKYALI
jgi:hypothetical protein